MAVTDALVMSDRAVIYADQEMTSPIGYVPRGKKIKVGEVARNKAQVYPIIVSGKLAYIRVIDVSTEKDQLDSTRLVAERFQKATKHDPKTRTTLSYFSYTSQISLDTDNG